MSSQLLNILLSRLHFNFFLIPYLIPFKGNKHFKIENKTPINNIIIYNINKQAYFMSS
jgi:hypothetical protein